MMANVLIVIWVVGVVLFGVNGARAARSGMGSDSSILEEVIVLFIVAVMVLLWPLWLVAYAVACLLTDSEES